MSKIKLAFLEEFRRPMRVGLKTATTRRGRHGEEGDTFEAFGKTFRITRIWAELLGAVDKYHYALEGFEAPDYFPVAWRHCGKRWTPNNLVWLHEFELVEPKGIVITRPPLILEESEER